MTLSEHPDDELEETFEHFDDDGDGSIDRDEFADVMDALGADMSSDELAPAPARGGRRVRPGRRLQRRDRVRRVRRLVERALK